MVDFTLELKCIDDLYMQKQYNEAINKCASNIELINDDERSNRPTLYKLYERMFRNYFRLDNEEQCIKSLNACSYYSDSTEESRETMFNRMRLCIVTGHKEEALPIVEDLINYYTDTENKRGIANTLIWKGEATEDLQCYLAARKILRSLPEDTSADEAFAERKIKALRHLS